MRGPYQGPLYVSLVLSRTRWLFGPIPSTTPNRARQVTFSPVLISYSRLRCRRRRPCSARTTRQHAVGGSESAWQSKQRQYSADESIDSIRRLLYSCWAHCFLGEQIMSKKPTALIASIRSQKGSVPAVTSTAHRLSSCAWPTLVHWQLPRRPAAWWEMRPAAIRPHHGTW
jgi:hypothetical protein